MVIIRSAVLPSDTHFAFHCAVIVGLCLLARRHHVSLEELGLARHTWATGARDALLVLLLLGAVVAGGAFGAGVGDDRVAVSLGSMLVRVLVVIPIGTVLMEELAFRGLLLALCRRVTTTWRAVLASSTAFGAWHVATAWNTAQGPSNARLAAVVGTVVATGGAGVAFCWLRLWRGSLLVPIGAHIATNSVAFAATWLASR